MNYQVERLHIVGHWIDGSYSVPRDTEEPEERLCAVNTGQGKV